MYVCIYVCMYVCIYCIYIESGCNLCDNEYLYLYLYLYTYHLCINVCVCVCLIVCNSSSWPTLVPQLVENISSPDVLKIYNSLLALRKLVKRFEYKKTEVRYP